MSAPQAGCGKTRMYYRAHHSSSLWDFGVLPSISFMPYSRAISAVIRISPVRSMHLSSCASAAMHLPTNYGDSESPRSSVGSYFAASMIDSVLTSPGYSENTATPYSISSCAVSRESLSSAALHTPYATLFM